MNKIEQLEHLLKQWKAAMNAPEIRKHSDMYISKNRVNRKIDAALEILNRPSNDVNSTGACTHEWETMSGKIEFVEKCAVCGEERR